jgi:hypothetical protein
MRLFTPSKVFLPFVALTAFIALPSKHSAQNGHPDKNCCTKAETQSGRYFAYTVVLQEYLTQADGSVEPTMRETIAVRGDGSKVMVMDSGTNDPKKAFWERIISFSSGKQVYVFEKTRRTSTTFDPTRTSTRWLPDPHNNCLIQGTHAQQFVGEEIVDGYRTAKLTGGPTTQWVALDYGCAPVKGQANWENGESSEKRLLSLIVGEPTPSLFDDPAGFEEVPPSQLFPDSKSDIQDKYYYSHRPSENGQPTH